MASLIIQDTFDPYYDGRETPVDEADTEAVSPPAPRRRSRRQPNAAAWQRLDRNPDRDAAAS